MFKNLFTLVFLFVGITAFAQTGSIKGIIKDSVSKEDIIGASIFLEGTTQGGATDIDGSFSIKNVQPGTYNVIINYISYNKKVIGNVVVSDGQETDMGEVGIAEQVLQGDEVVIVGQRQTQTEAAVIQEIKMADQVVSGISSEQISKSQDRDAAQVIARVPGVTIIDNRFVMVRGLNQRYNGVMLNGLMAPSTETDTRAFSFDIIPSAMLDRMLVYKSGADELPGDMTGSLIKVYTKNVVNENFTNVGASLSYRPGTTFTTQQVQARSATDFLGFDNGKRNLPSSFPSSLNSIGENNTKYDEVTKSLKADYTLRDKNINPDLRLNIGLGRVYSLGTKRLSTVASVNYSNTSQYINIEQSRNLYSSGEPTSLFNYNLKQLQNNVRLGLILNWALVLNTKHKIEFRNMYNQNGYTETTLRTGIDKRAGSTWKDISDRALYYQERGIYSGQFSGKHDINKDRTTLDWTTGYSYIFRNEPMYRRGGYYKNHGTDEPYRVYTPNQGTDNDASTFDSKLKEGILGLAANAEHKLKTKVEGKDPIKLRAGIYVERRSRSFDSRLMSYVKSANFNKFEADAEPIETIFRDENIDAVNGYTLNEITGGSNKYLASNFITAGYAGFTLPIRKLSLIGGLRVENNVQKLDGATFTGVKVDLTKNILSILPSLNATYNITQKMLLRAAIAKTINRPEFREIAPFGFYDFATSSTLVGNPYLKTAEIVNYDLRWELYPTPNELISFGVFYKDMTNPIELYIIPTGSFDPSYEFNNAPKAACYGVETEIKKSLAFIAPENKVINKFSYLLNFSLIKSEVDLGNVNGGQDSKRPLVGQSPYVINSGLSYNHENARTQVNLLYNVFGPRIFAIGDNQFATTFEAPRHTVDLTVTKGISKKFEIKGGIQDILNQPSRVVEDANRNFKLDASDNVVTYFKRGSYFTLGVNYKF